MISGSLASWYKLVYVNKKDSDKWRFANLTECLLYRISPPAIAGNLLSCPTKPCENQKPVLQTRCSVCWRRAKQHFGNSSAAWKSWKEWTCWASKRIFHDPGNKNKCRESRTDIVKYNHIGCIVPPGDRKVAGWIPYKWNALVASWFFPSLNSNIPCHQFGLFN